MLRHWTLSSVASPQRIQGSSLLAPRSYFWLGTALVFYVALCTGQRDRVWEADAWEHHRAIVAFAHAPAAPGNPTFESPEPSIRYSLYTAALAGLVRVTGIDAFDLLSVAAVINTVLLVWSVWFLLRELGEVAAASCVLIVMIGLWGGPPGYANSYALADLPWHQVNPSAFSFPLVLWTWALFLRARWWHVPVMISAMAVALNAHPMTAAFGLYAMVLWAFSGPREALRLQLVRFLLVAGSSFILCALWPWFDFVAAVRSHRDQLYWFNAGVVRVMLQHWCAPGLLGAVLALLIAARASVRRCLLCGAGVFVLAVATLPLRSATLARFPMPGMIFFHIALGVLVFRTGVLNCLRRASRACRVRHSPTHLPRARSWRSRSQR